MHACCMSKRGDLVPCGVIVSSVLCFQSALGYFLLLVGYQIG